MSIYLDDANHRLLKSAASAAGVSLSTFMAEAALRAIRRPNRVAAAQAMDALRSRLKGRVAAEEVLAWRGEGRE